MVTALQRSGIGTRTCAALPLASQACFLIHGPFRRLPASASGTTSPSSSA